MIELIKVTRLKVLEHYKLEIEFSNGDSGIADFSWIKDAEGEMLQPLKDEAFFSRAFISMGVPSWPNGFDVDAINLHLEMKEQKLLNRPAA